MASKNIATEFKAKIARALTSDAGRRELIGFINQRIEDQRALLDCLWEFSIGFSADWDHLEAGEKHRGLAIMYRLFGRAIELAGPLNELADFVLYVATLAREGRGGRQDARPLRPPATVAREQYVVYQNRWNQLPEQEQTLLAHRAQKKRQEFRDRRTLVTELVKAYQKANNGKAPTLEELFDFDPAPNTPRRDFDKAVKACEVSWRQFSWGQLSVKPGTEQYLKEMDTADYKKAVADRLATEPYLKEMDVAFQELRQMLLKAGDEPLAFYQLWKWIRDGRQKKVARTGPRGETYLETVEPIWSEIWRELYLEACYCAIRLAMGKWSMLQVQMAKGLSTDDRDFLLQPLSEGERENFAERLKWGAKNTVEFEELNRIRRRMNRFGRVTKLEHLDEFQTVALVNKIAKLQQSKPEQIEKMVVEASSQWVAFRDKFRIGQEVLDSFTIIWSDQGVAGTRVVVEFHNLKYQLFATTRQGLGELVRKAVWRKMQELGEQVTRFLLAYLEVLGLVLDVISAGTTGGFRQIAFQFITERMKEKATDAVLDAFHIENQAVHIVAGMVANLVRGPVPRAQAKGSFDAREPDVRGGAGQADARGLASTPIAHGDAKGVTNTGVKDIVTNPPPGAAPIQRPSFEKKTTTIEDQPRPTQQQLQPVGQRLQRSTTGIGPDQRSLGDPQRPGWQHQQTQQQQQAVKKSSPTHQPEEVKVGARDATSGKGTDRPATENRLQGKSVDKPPQGAGTQGMRDPGYPAWLQYRGELVKRFPLLETHLSKKPLYRDRGEPGLWEESVFTGSARLSWQVYLRKGRRVEYPKPHIQDSVQIDDIDRDGWLVDSKMVGIGAGREIKPARVPDVVEEIGRRSTPRTYPLFGEREQQQLLGQLQAAKENGLPGVRWETNSAQLKEDVDRFVRRVLSDEEREMVDVELLQR